MKTYIAFILLILAACGNPHLNKIDGLGTKSVPVVATPEALMAKGISVDDGLFLKTEESNISGLVKLQNLDLDKNWLMKVEFEKGSNFEFNGTGFPGIKGTCREELKGAESCLIDIKFHSKVVGLSADNLKISYYEIAAPTEIHLISYSLRGEKTARVTELTSKVSIKTISQESLLDFGKSIPSDVITGTLVVKNEGETDLNLAISLKDNEHITFRGKNFPGKDGTCGEELKVGKKCLLDMSFQAPAVGIYQDTVILTYSPVSENKKQTIKFPLVGEKTPKKKQGPLLASEVFSNTIDFGKVKVGVEVRKQFEIQNLGQTVYGVKELTLSNKPIFSYSGGKFPGVTGTCGDLILPGSCLIELAYKPAAVKKDTGTFKLLTKEGDSVRLDLVGEGAEEKKCESYNEYLVVPEKTYPAAQVIFPYLKSHASTTAKLTQLYGLEVNSYIKETDNYTVQDGMVYVTFKLPVMEGEIINMNFGVHVLKVIRDNFKDTESLCLSTKDVRKCSGHEFSLATWQALKNPKFWDKNLTPVSERYEKQFASGEKKCGSFQCMNLNTQYELSDIFELSASEMKTVRDEGVVTLIFSDDTRMFKMPRIAVKTKVVVTCE
jgi:hypothetical protein